MKPKTYQQTHPKPGTQFSSCCTAHAGLVDTLSGDGSFTVFAPTDQAFTDAGIDLANFNTDEANQTLVDILTYHVISGEVLSSALTDGMSLETLNGDNVTIGVGDNVTVNDATVTLADVVSSNGVIHVIDKVLTPPEDGPGDIPTIASSTGVHNVLVDAIIQAGYCTPSGDGPYTILHQQIKHSLTQESTLLISQARKVLLR